MLNISKWNRHCSPYNVRNNACEKIFAFACCQNYSTMAVTEISTLTFLGNTET